MRGMGWVFVFSLVVSLVSGCATTNKDADLQMQGLRNQVSLLEAGIQAKDEEILALQAALAKAQEQAQANAQAKAQVMQKPQIKEIAFSREKEGLFVPPNIRQVQLALKNAGFDPGRIDGVMGRKTKSALGLFQQAHDLGENVKVNKKTWALLKGYLEKE